MQHPSGGKRGTNTGVVFDSALASVPDSGWTTLTNGAVDLTALTGDNAPTLQLSTVFDTYRSVLAAHTHCVVLVNQNLTISQVEPTMETHFGWTAADLSTHNLLELIHPEDHQRAAQEVLRELDEPELMAASIVIRLRNKKDAWVDVEFFAVNCVADRNINGVIVALRDVSSQALSTRVLAAGDYLYRSLSTVASDGVTIVDANGKRVYSSPSFLSLLGYTSAEMATMSPAGLVIEEDRDMWAGATGKALREPGATARAECRMIRKNGRPIWVEATVVNLLADTSVRGFVVHVRDIDDRRRMVQQLHHRATVDDLTGLANRRTFLDTLNSMRNSNIARTLMFCDLDGFKQVNDTLGHSEGDDLLRRVGEIITELAPHAPCCSRIGGDEFCILLNAMDDHEIEQLSNNLESAISGLANEIGIPIGVSIGVATDDSNTALISTGSRHTDPLTDDLLTRADHDMYRVKRIHHER